MCGKEHPTSLHTSKSVYCQAMWIKVWVCKRERRRSESVKPQDEYIDGEESQSMFTLYSIPVSAPDRSSKKLALVLEDPGATHNFITNKLAKWMKLPSKPTCLTKRVLGDKHKNEQTRIYSLSLADMYGKEHMIQAIGLDSLTEVESAPKAMKLKELFPQAGKEAGKAFNRPHGNVNVMLGMASRSLHCKDCLEAGDLRLNKPVFSPGWVLTGVGGGGKGMNTDRRKRGNLNKGVCEERMLQAINHTKGGLFAIAGREQRTRPKVERGECAPGKSKRRRLRRHMKASGYLTSRSHKGRRGTQGQDNCGKECRRWGD